MIQFKHFNTNKLIMNYKTLYENEIKKQQIKAIENWDFSLRYWGNNEYRIIFKNYPNIETKVITNHFYYNYIIKGEFIKDIFTKDSDFTNALKVYWKKELEKYNEEKENEYKQKYYETINFELEEVFNDMKKIEQKIKEIQEIKEKYTTKFFNLFK